MLYRKSVLTALLVLIFLAFFGTLALSARMFPQNYDWRYRVISNLLSPRDNPGHCWLPACGIILTAGLMLPFAGYLRRNLESASPRAAEASSGAFHRGNYCADLRVHRFASTPARCAGSSAAFMSLLLVPQQVSWRLRCSSPVGAHGGVSEKICSRGACFGRGCQ